ncbi:shikimate dehydrogenase [Clostridium tetanomorphum]|nr:shikimate dehydrogenase [Clostridium tetanomorphum]MBP1863400.1 shikimate dehydrogenase [Clostridium tetanomorphum]NRS83497.1 shikimate dehydrogenase [Clostridium tetanomorphum]NRZ96697.1 shikimate dehydrogenase [Clostridium tetanomorphum]SQC01867.1 shikimate 5-dehydrogenase [Clostridium tetanomorphum]
MSMLFGLLGEKLGHSFSPQIHLSIFKELNIDGIYKLFEVKKEDLQKAIKGFKDLQVKGINVTIPYKVQVKKYLDYISEEAEKIGAVNTITFKDNKIVGYNTDYYGFKMMLDKFNVEVKNKKVVILGTGGAANSIIQYVLDEDAKDIALVTRNLNKVKDNFKKFNLINYDELNYLKQGDIIINTTPVGMYPNVDNSAVKKEVISNFNIAIDLIYNPRKTKFLKYAEESGLKILDGLYMLVGQAVKAEEIWNNVNISDSSIEKIYKNIEIMLSGEEN